MKTKLFLLTALLLGMLNLLKAQTETEPNNTPATANTVTVGQCLKVAFNSNSDEDYFKITLARGGVLIIQTANIPANNRPIIEIYPPNSSGYIHNGAAPTRGSEARTETILAAGTYYIRLRNFYSVPDYGQFDLCFDLDTTDPAEPDNSFALATPVNIGDCFNAKMQGYDPKEKDVDIDYYKVSAPKDGVLLVSVTQVPSNLRLHLRFIKEDLSVLPDILASSAGLAVSGAVTVPKGTYYFIIEDYSGKLDSNAYRVCVGLDTSDVFEYNNSTQDAKVIPFDSCVKGKIFGLTKHSLTSGTDIDFFSFTVQQGGEFTASIPVVPQEITMMVSLYDSLFSLIEVKTFPKGQPATLTKNICKGKHYLQLNDIIFSGASTSEYQLCLSFKKDEGCNESFSNAYKTVFCDTVFSSFGKSADKGYYSFIGNGQDITVKTSNVAPSIIAKLTAYDRDFKPIGSPVIASGAGKDVLLTVSNTISGDPYYILAENSNNATSSMIYRFLVIDDNCKSSNPTTGISEALANESVTIYPNPSSGEFIISSPTGEMFKVWIYDILGQAVYSNDFYTGGTISLDVTDGVYFINIHQNSACVTQRLIINK